MFKRVLVPLARSELAEKVLVHLPRFIDPANTEILVVGMLETLRYAHLHWNIHRYSLTRYTRAMDLTTSDALYPAVLSMIGHEQLERRPMSAGILPLVVRPFNFWK